MIIKNVRTTDLDLIIDTDEGIRRRRLSFSGAEKIIAKCKDFKERQCLVEYSTWGTYKKSEWFSDIWEVKSGTDTHKAKIFDSALAVSDREDGPEITEEGWEIDPPLDQNQENTGKEDIKENSRQDIEEVLKFPLGKVFKHHSSQKIYGPPGTGKTSVLIEIVKKAIASGTKPEDIAFVAFTNQAANVAKERVAQEFPELGSISFPNFSTLHAFATRLGGTGGADLMQEKDFKNFDPGIYCTTDWTELGNALSSVVRYKHAVLEAYSLSLAKLENLDYQSINIGGVFDSLMNFFSIDKKKPEQLRENKAYYCKEYLESYLSYKSKYHLINFDDVIIKVADKDFPKEHIPTFKILIIDEAQDLTKLQWKIAKKLINHSEKAYIAGDDDQAIMENFGSDPSTFINLKTTEAPRVLDQSYRVPRTNYDYVSSGILKYIRELQNRAEKVWKPQNRNGSLGSPPTLKPQVIKHENETLLGAPVEVFRPEISIEQLMEKVKIDWGNFNTKLIQTKVKKEKDFLNALEEGEKLLFKIGAAEVLEPLLKKPISIKEEKSELDPELINQIISGVNNNNIDERHLFLLKTLGVFKDEKFLRLVDISQKEIKEPPNWLIMSATKRTGEKISQGFKDMGIPHFYRNRPVLEATKEKTLIRVQTIHTSKGAEANNTAIVFAGRGDVFGVVLNVKLAYVALTRARKRMFPRVVSSQGLLTKQEYGEQKKEWNQCVDKFNEMFPSEILNYQQREND